MKYIFTALTAYIVATALNLLMVRAKRSKTSSIYKFHMSPSRDLSIIGWICGAFFTTCLIGAKYANQLSSFIVVACGSLIFLGLILILAPVRGFMDAYVDGDMLTSTKLFVFKKTVKIQDIDYCTQTRGGFHIYVKGKKALFIDGFCTNLRNFEKRMEKRRHQNRGAMKGRNGHAVFFAGGIYRPVDPEHTHKQSREE